MALISPFLQTVLSGACPVPRPVLSTGTKLVELELYSVSASAYLVLWTPYGVPQLFLWVPMCREKLPECTLPIAKSFA